jgi:hypothetical protein
MLLKMGLETLASDISDAIWDERFDSARDFALTGRDDLSWWYIQHEGIAKVSALCKGIMPVDSEDGVELSIMEPLEQGEVFRFRYLSHTFIVPLIPYTVPAPREELLEPEYRIFTV